MVDTADETAAAVLQRLNKKVTATSRDRAIPGWWLFRRLNHHRVPSYAVLAVVLFSLIISIPALWSNKAGLPFAFFALTGICTVGLYIAYILPVWLRYRHPERFQVGPWNLGKRWKGRWPWCRSMAWATPHSSAFDSRR